jgi:hypothetical protein
MGRILQAPRYLPDVEISESEDFFVYDIRHEVQQLFRDDRNPPSFTDILQTKQNPTAAVTGEAKLQELKAILVKLRNLYCSQVDNWKLLTFKRKLVNFHSSPSGDFVGIVI